LGGVAPGARVAPVLGIVDDAQWLAPPSAEGLLFTARRLDSEGVALLFGLREGEADAFDAGGLGELGLTGLDREHALELLSRSLGPETAPDVAEQLVGATQGNPLALLEAPALLSESQLAGKEPLDEPLPAAPSVERAFRRQIEALPTGTQEALL